MASGWDLGGLLAAAKAAGRILDVSMPVSPDMPVYKNRNEKRPRFEIVREHAQGARETRVSIDLHTGTHLDFPLHMVEDGADSNYHRVEDIVAPCLVLDLTGVRERITKEDLARKLDRLEHGDWVLLKTRNSFIDAFDFDFVYLDETGARYLAEGDIRIRGVGIDALGIERGQPGHETHKTLFAHGIGVLEGLRLRDVPAGRYTMIAAPIKLVGVEAAPTRVILFATPG